MKKTYIRPLDLRHGSVDLSHGGGGRAMVQLIGEVFGPQVGAHARSAFGVAQIPMGACVEIELIAEVA